MKNYQKILFPFTVAFVLSLSAFVSTERNQSLELLKENKIGDKNPSSTYGSYTCLLVQNGCDQINNEVVENKVVVSGVNNNIMDLQQIIKSYK